MPASTPVPTLSQMQTLDTAYLREAADWWTHTAVLWEDSFTEIHQRISTPGGTPWTGQAGATAQEHAYQGDLMKVRGASDQLRKAAAIAHRGDEQLQAGKQGVLQAVHEARADGFEVSNLYSVTDNSHGGSAEYQAARQIQAQEHASFIRHRLSALLATDRDLTNNIITTTEGLANLTFPQTPSPDDTIIGDNKHNPIQTVDNKTEPEPEPGDEPGVPNPANSVIGDKRFGHWENVPPPPPHTGLQPPPLQAQYRPFPDGTPSKVGPTTGMYTPGQTWIGNIDPPAVQGQEGYRFTLAGEQATTVTRNVYDNGRWQQQRWVQNVYQYQRNTSMVFGGDVGMKGIEGKGEFDIGGLPPIQNIDTDWKPISLHQIAALSGGNSGTAYYLPDGCGGAVTFIDGLPQGSSGLAPRGPIMTAPR